MGERAAREAPSKANPVPFLRAGIWAVRGGYLRGDVHNERRASAISEQACLWHCRREAVSGWQVRCDIKWKEHG